MMENKSMKISLPPLQAGTTWEINRSLQAIRKNSEAAAARWKEVAATHLKNMEPVAVQVKAFNAHVQEAAAAMRKTAHMMSACSQQRAQNPVAELGKLVEELDERLSRQKPTTRHENWPCNQP